MANANFDSTSLTSKAVSLVVAIVVFACVLVPIVGSMAGDDGGSKTYTNTGEYYYQPVLSDDVEHHFNYRFQETEVNGSSAVASIVKIDGATVYDNVDVRAESGFIPSIPIGWNDAGFLVIIPTATGIYYETPTKFEAIEVIQVETDGWTEIDLTIHNGVVTYLDGDGETYYTFSESVSYLMSANAGEYVMADSLKVAKEDVTVYAFLSDYVGEGGNFWFDMVGKFNTSDLTQDAVITDSIQFVMDDDKTCTCTINSVSDGDYITITSVDAEVTNLDPNFTRMTEVHIFAPTSFTVDSGENSDSGMVGTLIQIIPVFVALGLILAIVGMFYNSNRMD